MMNSRYFITAGMLMVCFYIAMPISTLAASASLVSSITAVEVEEIVKKDISKLSPQIVEDILQGKFPSIDVGTIEEMIQMGLLGDIMGMTVETFKEMLKKNILSLSKTIIDDLMNGKISGISIQEIVSAITGSSFGNNNGGGECTMVHFPYTWWCMPHPCDNVLKCVMEKQRKTLNDRLDDLINTIKANTKQTKHQTKIIEQEVLAYRRLEARVKKEALSLKEARYLSNKIKNSVSIGSTIETSKKGQ